MTKLTITTFIHHLSFRNFLPFKRLGKKIPGIYIYTLFTAAIVFLPMIAYSSGLQVSPARLDFTVNSGKNTSQEIVVANPTADVQIFEVYPDDFTELIKPETSSFTLESGARKTVNITVVYRNSENGQKLSTNLSVVGKPLANSRLAVGAGAKIPISITFTAAEAKKSWMNQFWTRNLGFGLPLLLIIGFVLYKRRKKTAAAA